MNYRRGFQRVYAVLAVAWVVGLLFVLPADRLNFWSAQPNETTIHGPWEAYSKGAASAATTDLSKYGTVTSNELDLSKYGPGKYRVTTDSGVYEVTVGAAAASDASSRSQRALWLSGVLLLPPGFGYLAIFLVIPWIYRGFRGLILEVMPTKEVPTCTFQTCAERAVETNKIESGIAQFRCATHADDPEWIALARLRLPDMRPLAPGQEAS